MQPGPRLSGIGENGSIEPREHKRATVAGVALALFLLAPPVVQATSDETDSHVYGTEVSLSRDIPHPLGPVGDMLTITGIHVAGQSTVGEFVDGGYRVTDPAGIFGSGCSRVSRNEVICETQQLYGIRVGAIPPEEFVIPPEEPLTPPDQPVRIRIESLPGVYESAGFEYPVPVDYQAGAANSTFATLHDQAVGQQLSLGEGDDQGSGGPGNDEIFLGGGRDMASGGAGNDFVHGGDGNDAIGSFTGESGSDTYFGNEGDDRLDAGSPGDDLAFGGPGNDILTGLSEAEYVGGDGEPDELWCGSGDRDLASPGNDDLVGYDCEFVGTESFFLCGCSAQRAYPLYALIPRSALEAGRPGAQTSGKRIKRIVIGKTKARKIKRGDPEIKVRKRKVRRLARRTGLDRIRASWYRFTDRGEKVTYRFWIASPIQPEPDPRAGDTP